MGPKMLQVPIVSQAPEVPQFSKVPMVPFKVLSALIASKIPEVSMVPTMLLVLVVLWVSEVPVIPRVSKVPEVPLDASDVFPDAKSGFAILGDVNERSGFLCKIGGFCL